MKRFRLEPGADRRLDDIVAYTRERWGDAQAIDYIESLFAEFERIATHQVPWERSNGALGVDGFRRRCRSHVIYWRQAPDGQIAIFSILHQRMHIHERLREDDESR